MTTLEKTGAIGLVFKLYLIKEYQRLKEQESSPLLEESQIKFAYTSEADMLNLALFHYTAKQRHSLTEMFQDSFSNVKLQKRNSLIIKYLRH